MLDRILSRLSYANVMATIAVFLALGGGYAMAVGGSGSLQKGGQFGFPDSSTFQTIRILNGIGRIDARCTHAPATTLEIQLHVSGTFPSDEGIIYRKDTLGGQNPEEGGLTPGTAVNFQAPPAGDLIRLWTGTNESNAAQSSLKRPQAHIDIATHEPTLDNSCSLARVEVLALNTED